MYFKAVTMNNSGNVGKSMICDTLLKPRMEGVSVVKVETLNSDGTQDETISAKDIKLVFERIDEADRVIVDVGSSNVEIFMSNLRRMGDAYEDFDLFVIPTTPNHKQQIDTIATVNSLLDLGVDKDRIKLVFNFYDDEYKIEQLYSTIFDDQIAKDLKLSIKRNVVTISENPVFDMLGEMGKSFIEIANDNRDFKALLRAEKNKEKRAVLSHQRSAQRFANGFIKELDRAFSRLNVIQDAQIIEA